MKSDFDIADQHQLEASENWLRWQSKPLLQRIYVDFYRLIKSRLALSVEGKVVEIGSGIGAIKSVIPQCLCTDRFPGASLDLVEDVYNLSFGDSELANVILFDVFHHLQFPGDALSELHRVLTVGGRVVLFEPTLSALGWLVYGCFHKEPIMYSRPITWHADGDTRIDLYYAAQGNAYRVFVKGELLEHLAAWNVVEVKQFAAIAYVASGGFAGPQLYPAGLYKLLSALERPLNLLPQLFATRLLVVLERKPRTNAVSAEG